VDGLSGKRPGGTKPFLGIGAVGWSSIPHMDKDFEKGLRELMQRSQELARQSEQLAAQTEIDAAIQGEKETGGRDGAQEIGFYIALGPAHAVPIRSRCSARLRQEAGHPSTFVAHRNHSTPSSTRVEVVA